MYIWIQYMVEFLVSKAPMLKDYFSFEIDPVSEWAPMPQCTIVLVSSPDPLSISCNIDKLGMTLRDDSVFKLLLHAGRQDPHSTNAAPLSLT